MGLRLQKVQIVNGSLQLVFLLLASVVDYTNTKTDTVKYSSFQIEITKKQRLQPIGSLMAWIVVAWGSYPDIVLTKP
jgi:hypothetical protein